VRRMPLGAIIERAYKTGDLIRVIRLNEIDFIPCPTGAAVVVRASSWHHISPNSVGGDVPPGCRRYYQILKVLKDGQTYPNVHSHNVELLSG
jgi:hypothetical protein